MIRYCKSCKWWEGLGLSIPNTKVGVCRFNPPTLEGNWPRAHEDDWCSKHEDSYNKEFQTIANLIDEDNLSEAKKELKKMVKIATRDDDRVVRFETMISVLED